MKHMNRISKLFAGCSIAASIFLTSCGAGISVKALSDKSTELQVQMDIGGALTQTLAALTGSSDLSAILPASELQQELKSSDVSGIKISYPKTSAINLQGTIAAPEKQRNSLGTTDLKLKDFVLCSANELKMTLSPATIQAAVEALPEDAVLFLDLFMAPVFTGESMSQSEYLMLVASVYGDQISSELKNAKLSLSMECPSGKTIKKAVSSGKEQTASGSKATFEIPLVEFFTLSSTKIYSISW